MSATFFVTLVTVAITPLRLTTTAETSHYQRTGRYSEVEYLCNTYAKVFAGKVKCEKFGTTPLGRPLLSLVASADGTFSPEDCAKKQRPVVFLQGGIHAGEVDGKDAGFEVLRGLLDGSLVPQALSKLTVVFVPVFNVDGHERFGAYHRPNQNGPAEMGWRVTAENLNLNRDFTKIDAPETRAMVQLLHRYDPILYADLHVTDGAKFQHDVSVTFEPWQTGPEGLRVLGKALRVALLAELKDKGHLPVDFYPSFIKDDDPASGFEYGWPPPRFATAYWAANNRFGLLVETHSWKDYATRVKATFDVCVALLRLASEDGTRWLKAAKEADALDEKKGGTTVPLLYEHTGQPKELEFLGYAYTREDSNVSGKKWVRYDDTKPQVWKVPYFDELGPAVALPAPKGGYLVPPPDAAWVSEKLKVHGVRFTTLKQEKKAAPVDFVRVDPKFRAQPFEGRMTVQTRGEWKSTTRDITPGTLFVPIAQPHVALVMHLFEPASPDSFVSWGFFNAYFEQKEYLEDYVLEAFAREQLKDPNVKAEFDARLKDEAFAKDPDARLRFFFVKHPSYDTALNVYPVWRTAEVDWR